MRFAERGSRHTVRAVLSALLVASGCADGLDPLSTVPPPAEFVVEAVRLGVVRLTWARVDPDVVSYAIERRANLTGAFVPLADQVPQTGLAQGVYIDTDIEPDTYYGYRVYAITRFGDRSPPSVVGGTKSPPLPGIEVRTASLFPTPESVDPDGYEVTIEGPDTVRQAIGVSATRRFAPLAVGQYRVTLGGIVDRCATDGQAARTVTVSDTTPKTVVPLAFQVICRDPSRGEITVIVTTSGTSVDAEHPIELFGEASDASLPDSVRIVARTQTIGAASGSTRFINLRPGTYDLTLEDLAANCQLEGTPTRTVGLDALENEEVRFRVSCSSENDGGPQDPGYQYRGTWTSLGGDEYALDVRIDMRAFNRPDIIDVTTSGVTGDPLTGAQVTIAYDASRLAYDRFEAASAPSITTQSVNGSALGSVAVISAVSGVGPTGNVGFARLIFRRVTGSTAGTVTTATTLHAASSRSGATTVNITADVRINEGTLTIETGGGGGTNQAPNAEANGPYAGTAGVPLSLSSTGSSDPDGMIASYSWALGNGQTATGASPSVTYAAAGTYTAALTVTDDDGATDTDQATVTITGGGGTTNQLPIAEANGPYAATVGVPLTLSSTGSTDPDGSIASYSWALGNGQTAVGASPTVTYAAPGTYTLVLTVTDNRGGTDTDQATVTVANAPATKPLIWRNVVGPIDITNNQVAITVSYDLRGDVPETPGVEVLASFKVDSLKWNPSVLQFSAINLGPNISGTSNQAKAAAGNLAFQGSVSGAQAQGLITIATIRFKLVGTPGSRTTTATFLGTLQGAPVTGDFVYNSKTAIVEGEFVSP